jgi:hypothetical protein
MVIMSFCNCILVCVWLYTPVLYICRSPICLLLCVCVYVCVCVSCLPISYCHVHSHDDVRVVVFKGTGKFFSNGLDLTFLTSHPEKAKEFFTEYVCRYAFHLSYGYMRQLKR